MTAEGRARAKAAGSTSLPTPRRAAMIPVAEPATRNHDGSISSAAAQHEPSMTRRGVEHNCNRANPKRRTPDGTCGHKETKHAEQRAARNVDPPPSSNHAHDAIPARPTPVE